VYANKDKNIEPKISRSKVRFIKLFRSFTEEFLEFRARLLDARRVRRRVSAGARFEMVAKVGAFLIAHFLGCRLATVFGDCTIVIDAQLANV
jgi:hypothetical protein